MKDYRIIGKWKMFSFFLSLFSFVTSCSIGGNLEVWRGIIDENSTGGDTVYYSVIFIANGGTPAPDQQNVLRGGKAIVPAAMNQTGYMFMGWYRENNFVTKWNFGTDTVTTDIILYAQWQLSETITTDSGIQMNRIPAGTFIMGSTLFVDDASPPHKVTLTKDFYMGVYEVTQEQYIAVTGNNPSYFTTANGRAPDSGETDNKRPVEQVTWGDAIEFCNKLSVIEGLTPAYTIISRYPASGYPITSVIVTVNWSANGYRLPTEAEWEYACRAGTATTYNTGDMISDDTGWYLDNSKNRTHEVGKKPANAWGLYDMHGNVKELCWDWKENYLGGDQTDPTGANFGSYPAARGGSYSEIRFELHSAKRHSGYRHNSTGFRLVRLYMGENTKFYNVLFAANGGTPVPDQQTILNGGKVNVPALMTKSGYTFDGWYRENTFTTKWDFGIDTVTANITLYAHWDPIETITTASGIKMNRIPAGTFIMGSSDDYDASPMHYVTLTKSFYMGVYEVTQEQYFEVTGVNPSNFTTANGSTPDSGETDNKRPVESVTWYDAVEFCNKLSVNEGLTPAYTITDRSPAGGYPITDATVTINWNVNGYRLPTEAEWEYACRAGTTTAYNTGDTISDGTGWYSTNSGNKTHEVGKKPANNWGLYDMHGNIYEWCWDLQGNYSSGDQTDPNGSSNINYGIRIVRGGSHSSDAFYLRSASRGSSDPGIIYIYSWYSLIGFRLVRP